MSKTKMARFSDLLEQRKNTTNIPQI